MSVLTELPKRLKGAIRKYNVPGATIGQYSFLRILPERNLAVALLTNGGDTVGLYAELFSEVFGALGKVQEPGPPEPAPRATVDLTRFAGSFENITTRARVLLDKQGSLRFTQVDKTGTGTWPMFKGRQHPETHNRRPGARPQRFMLFPVRNGRANYVSSGFRQYRRQD